MFRTTLISDKKCPVMSIRRLSFFNKNLFMKNLLYIFLTFGYTLLETVVKNKKVY